MTKSLFLSTSFAIGICLAQFSINAFAGIPDLQTDLKFKEMVNEALNEQRYLLNYEIDHRNHSFYIDYPQSFDRARQLRPGEEFKNFLNHKAIYQAGKSTTDHGNTTIQYFVYAPLPGSERLLPQFNFFITELDPEAISEYENESGTHLDLKSEKVLTKLALEIMPLMKKYKSQFEIQINTIKALNEVIEKMEREKTKFIAEQCGNDPELYKKRLFMIISAHEHETSQLLAELNISNKLEFIRDNIHPSRQNIPDEIFVKIIVDRKL